MKISTANEGEIGWYNGLLKRDTQGEQYKLQQLDNTAEVLNKTLAEEVWEDSHGTGLEVIMKGRIDVEELLTGTEVFELGYVDRAGVIIEHDYDGRQVGVAGYDLVFMNGDDAVVYRNDSREGLEEDMNGWFDDEDADEYMEELESVLEAQNWPWNS